MLRINDTSPLYSRLNQDSIFGENYCTVSFETYLILLLSYDISVLAWEHGYSTCTCVMCYDHQDLVFNR